LVQRLQVGLKIVRVVRQSIQVGTAQDQRAGVLGGIDAYRWAGIFLHGDFLLLSRHAQLQI
jgi:hypothetical protein